MPRRLDAPERSRPGERSAQPPLHRAAVILGGRGEDLEAQVGHRVKELGDELAHTLGGCHVAPAAYVLASARRPHAYRCIEIAISQRLKVAARDRLGAIAADAAPAFGDLLHVRSRLLHLRGGATPKLL